VREPAVWALLLPAAYVLGTFPSAQLVARSSGVDITAYGSGNPGASNVTRALGWRKGVWVFVLDAAKGAAAAGLGLAVGGRVAAYALGAAAIVGHVAPVTHRFRGGKGVATGGGVLGVLHPIGFAAVAVVWWVLGRLTGKAAVGSIVAVCLVPVGLALDGAPAWEFAGTLALCSVILARHAGNLRRLVRHEEHELTGY
jgi:glycerol-3-phosphate acyltransferase PlsY